MHRLSFFKSYIFQTGQIETIVALLRRSIKTNCFIFDAEYFKAYLKQLSSDCFVIFFWYKICPVSDYDKPHFVILLLPLYYEK